MNGLNYLLQANLYLLLFMGFYVLVLRNETFFRQNRFFLNTSIFLSFLIPFINSGWFRELFITQTIREAAIIPSQMIYESVVVGINEESSSLTAADLMFWIYIAGAVFLSIRFFFRLAIIRSSLKVEKGSAFSFFKTLVVDRSMPKVDTIIDHEKVHMRQWHSADIIFIELAAIINWFNPVMYLYKKEIRHIHEFIADEEAATLMRSKSDYAMLLFSNTLGVDPLHLSNNFFNKSLLKRRIMMLHKNRSRRTGLWKYGFSAPLFMLMLIVSAATASSERNELSIDSDNSLASIEKITALPLPVMMSIGKDKATGIKYDQSTSSAISVPSGSHLVADHTDLKKHIARTIGYTDAAKAANTAGYIQVNFLVKGKKISGVEITKKLHPDLDNQVLEAFKSFDSEISIPDNDYVITVMYLDTSRPVKDQMTEKPSKNVLFAKNYLGEVLAFIRKDGTLNAGWDMSVGRPNPVTGKMETIGFDGASAQDKAPEFPGGMKAWQEYLAKNLRYTNEARNNNIQGKVIVSFTVEKDGGIADIKILRGIGGGLDEEAVRLVARSPNWIPGTKNGVPVNISFTAPINFSISGSENPIVASTRAATTDAILDFSKVEVLPEYPGGMTGWGEYLSKNLKYPEMAKKNKITGRVILEFIVEKDGDLTDVKVLRGIGGGADEEAVRVVKNAPNWKPGILNGQAVRVKYTMPIFFQLSGQ